MTIISSETTDTTPEKEATTGNERGIDRRIVDHRRGLETAGKGGCDWTGVARSEDGLLITGEGLMITEDTRRAPNNTR